MFANQITLSIKKNTSQFDRICQNKIQKMV